MTLYECFDIWSFNVEVWAGQNIKQRGKIGIIPMHQRNYAKYERSIYSGLKQAVC